MGLAVLAVGAAAVISLLKFTVLGTLDSRHVSNATTLTNSAAEQLHSAALEWNAPDNSDLGAVPFFGAAAVLAAATPGLPGDWMWFGSAGALPTGMESWTLAGDQFGTPLTTAYCTHMRLTWITNPAAVGANPAGDAIRVELRTFWARTGRPIGAECAANAETVIDPLFLNPAATVAIGGIQRSKNEFGTVFTTTIVRRNTQ